MNKKHKELGTKKVRKKERERGKNKKNQNERA